VNPKGQFSPTRIPFIVAVHTPRELTDIQARRGTRILEASRTYRNYLARLRRAAKHRADKHRLGMPKSGGFFYVKNPLSEPSIDLFCEAIEALDAGQGNGLLSWVTVVLPLNYTREGGNFRAFLRCR
jgi:hypothetical protein